jgi:hypothetical protein
VFLELRWEALALLLPEVWPTCLFRSFHGLGLNAVKPNRLFGVSSGSWQSCLVGHTPPSLLPVLSQHRTMADPAAAAPVADEPPVVPEGPPLRVQVPTRTTHTTTEAQAANERDAVRSD